MMRTEMSLSPAAPGSPELSDGLDDIDLYLSENEQPPELDWVPRFSVGPEAEARLAKVRRVDCFGPKEMEQLCTRAGIIKPNVSIDSSCSVGLPVQRVHAIRGRTDAWVWPMESHSPVSTTPPARGKSCWRTKVQGMMSCALSMVVRKKISRTVQEPGNWCGRCDAVSEQDKEKPKH
mmetsp:Transcript_26013/g.60263  ORF Transcript_26013/g.60263 Transcript_26013/m.60263 type:complete len:177 (+) Transcript_26013:35-565(+)